MRKTRSMAVLAVALGGGALLSFGCTAPTKQARDVEAPASGILLGDTSMLRAGEGEEALRVYKDQTIDWARYTKVMIDPVLFQSPEKASNEELADLQKLATNLHTNLQVQLGGDYQVVTEPGPDTLRVQMAFYDAEKKGATHFLSSVVPIGLGVSIIKNFATGKPLSVGGLAGEVKVTDAQTGNLLGAALDRRVGTQYGKGMFDSWAEANDALVYWAKRMRFALCQLRGATNCVEP